MNLCAPYGCAAIGSYLVIFLSSLIEHKYKGASELKMFFQTSMLNEEQDVLKRICP